MAWSIIILIVFGIPVFFLSFNFPQIIDKHVYTCYENIAINVCSNKNFTFNEVNFGIFHDHKINCIYDRNKVSFEYANEEKQLCDKLLKFW